MTDFDAADHFRALYELTTDRSASLEEKINRAITVGRDRLGVQYGVLSYTGSGEYEIVDSTITTGDYVAGSVHELDTTWCRHVVDDRTLLAIADAEDSAFADDRARDATGLQCYIGAPIEVDGDIYGALCFSGEEPRPDDFSEDEERFVRLITQWISQEIERKKHYDALDRQNERLSEFAGVLAHDIRNPLTSARGYTELVLESDSIGGVNREHLETSLDAIDRMEAMITDTLALAREGEDVGERESVVLGALAQKAWETIRPDGATLDVSDDRTILADESRLRRVFENLFRNVDEHCGDGVTVTVRGTDDGFVVRDDGPGLSPEIADSLFDGEATSDRIGLGLLIVERVVTGHGWHGAVTMEGGTRFEFSGVGRVTDPPEPA